MLGKASPRKYQGAERGLRVPETEGSEISDRDARIRSFDEVLHPSPTGFFPRELAASVAHEIKNPLISIEGFAKRIEKSSDLERIREYASFIEKESERLSRMC